jgi:multiple sugar transport system permease protein
MARPGLKWTGSLGRCILHLGLILGGLVMIGPFVWMFLTTFKTLQEISLYPPTLLPQQFTLEHYHKVFRDLPVLKLFFNSIYLSIVPTLSNILLGSIGGFIFAKLRFKGRDVLFFLTLITMIIPLETRVIPLYLLFQKMNWVDTYQAAFIPPIIGPFSLFLMRQHILQIPNALLDAARMDGCSLFRAYCSIVFPLIRPAVATVAIVTFMWNWRSLLWPLLVLDSPGKKTLEMSLSTYVMTLGGASDTNYGSYMAFATIGIIPVLIVFLILQRQFIKSLALSGLK